MIERTEQLKKHRDNIQIIKPQVCMPVQSVLHMWQEFRFAPLVSSPPFSFLFPLNSRPCGTNTLSWLQVENDISSSSVRRLLAQGRSIKYLVPDPVLEYISRHKLAELPAWKAQQ